MYGFTLRCRRIDVLWQNGNGCNIQAANNVEKNLLVIGAMGGGGGGEGLLPFGFFSHASILLGFFIVSKQV